VFPGQGNDPSGREHGVVGRGAGGRARHNIGKKRQISLSFDSTKAKKLSASGGEAPELTLNLGNIP